MKNLRMLCKKVANVWLASAFILLVAGCGHSGDVRRALLTDNPPPHKYHGGDGISFTDRSGVTIESVSDSFSLAHGPIYHVLDREYGVYQDVSEDFLDKLAAKGTVLRDRSLADYWEQIDKEKVK